MLEGDGLGIHEQVGDAEGKAHRNDREIEPQRRLRRQIGKDQHPAPVDAVGQRADVVGRRNALLALSQTLSTLVTGQILDRLGFPQNY